MVGKDHESKIIILLSKNCNYKFIINITFFPSTYL